MFFGQGFHPMLQQAYADRLKTWADYDTDAALTPAGGTFRAALPFGRHKAFRIRPAPRDQPEPEPELSAASLAARRYSALMR